MAYTADPWNTATPVVGNIVRDATPPEFIALKQVNKDRPRVGCLGCSAFNVNANLNIGIGFISVNTKIPMLQAALFRGNFNTGEYTCDQTGIYRLDGLFPNVIVGAANAVSMALVVEKFTGGAWVQVTTVGQPSVFPNSVISPAIAIGAYVAMTAGEKLRLSMVALAAASQNFAIAAQNANAAYIYIEFLRTP